MNTKLLKKLRKLFYVGYAPRDIQRHNIREWVRSVRLLGGSYVLYNSTFD